MNDEPIPPEVIDFYLKMLLGIEKPLIMGNRPIKRINMYPVPLEREKEIRNV